MPMILKRNGLLRSPRGPFAFPGTSARFDPSHIAANSVLFSGVSLGGTFINVLRGRGPTTTNGTPAPVIVSPIGSGMRYSASGDYHLFSGNPTGIESICTIAGIFMVTGTITAGSHFLFESGSGSRAVGLYWNNLGRVFFNRYGLTDTSSSAINTVTAGVPYFVCASSDGATQTNFLLQRLDTGAVSSEQVATASAPGSGNGTYIIGNSANLAAETPAGPIAAVMFSRALTSVAAMQQWARDPWAFWYPR